MNTYIVEFQCSRKKVKVAEGLNFLVEIRKSFGIGDDDILQEFDVEGQMYFDVDDLLLVENKARLNVVIKRNHFLESTPVDDLSISDPELSQIMYDYIIFKMISTSNI